MAQASASGRQTASSTHVSPATATTHDPQPTPKHNAPPAQYESFYDNRVESNPVRQERDYNSGSAGASPSVSRRKEVPPPAGPSSSHNAAAAAAVSSSSSGQVSAGDSALPREESQVINRLVIADPDENIQREQARVAEAVPVSSEVPNVAALSLADGEQEPRRRQEHLKTSAPRKETKFGEYILGQTLGEGEFGKVKMGWKKEGGVQVAIKLIRRESLGHNPNRLPKIYREISILRELQHPNIVRLHEMVETERHIGIILEYASGGELFDYILNHRYLKDNAARRLFAQLVSGVGYLHKKGIVHRDLKLENLLLDRNRNIIITDFGFANTFNPNDELGEDIEYNLGNKELMQKLGLEQVRSDGHRRGDLMQTSCGSPCYAAPELVVSDSLYTGRKVDVWSCGVILYAMLAGYLPFDDDPANPEGDNINLLYKYIVSTPLTFPEYVTPHARDLLRRILVPDPRKRADLFEVARHSWLSEYAHVVGFITSSTTTTNDIANATVPSEDLYETSTLGRSASVRESSKPHAAASPGGLSSTKHAPAIDTEKPAQKRDAKRRTVQVEYVAPASQTARGESTSPAATALPPPQLAAPPGSSQSKTRARDSSAGPVEVTKPYSSGSTRPQRPVTQSTMDPPSRPGREPARSVSDTTAFSMISAARPSTAGTMDKSVRLPSRGNSYGQPAAAQVAPQTAEGRFSQPKSSGYIISGTMPEGASSRRDSSTGRPLSQVYPDQMDAAQERPKGHKRSNTVESITNKIFGRTNSRRESQGAQDAPRPEKPSRHYPPVSMRNAMPANEAVSRTSTDSRRESYGLSKQSSDGGDRANKRSSRRFSFLPSSFSRMSFTSKEPSHEGSTGSRRGSVAQGNRPTQQNQGVSMAYGRGRSPSASTSGSTIPVLYDSQIDTRRDQARMPRSSQQQPMRGATAPDLANFQNPDVPQQNYTRQTRQQAQQYSSPPPSAGHQANYTSNPSYEAQPPVQQESARPLYPAGFNDDDRAYSAAATKPHRQPTVLQKNRKFGEAYESSGGSGGSSGGARRVMDWFRKRGKDRSG